MPTKGRVWKARKMGKVVIKERIAATVAQGECIYRSVRGARLLQCERSVSTAMREEHGHSHARGAGPQPRERSWATAMEEKNAVINAQRAWRMPTKGRVWKARKNGQGSCQRKQCSQRSTRRAHVLQCEGIVATAVREERGHSHARGGCHQGCQGCHQGKDCCHRSARGAHLP